MKVASLVFVVLLSGCGRYSDFRLPAPNPVGPKSFAGTPLTGMPVLTRGGPGEWDSIDVLNPSVVHASGTLWNLYSGFDGRTWRTGFARLDNGVWQKMGRVISPEGWEGTYIAANGSALNLGAEVFYWYEAGDPLRIGLARSHDGQSWTKHGTPVLETGPRGSFDERAVADPYVIRAGSGLFLFYLGQDRANRQRLGVARSTDGITWQKLRSNPILDLGAAGAFDENGLGEPAVWDSGGVWWMLYTGRDREERRRIGLAKSTDGLHWDREKSFTPLQGAEAWNSQVVCDPHVELQPDGSLRLWYGGGDVAHPAERLNGQIGEITLR